MLYQLLLLSNMVSTISISVIGPFFPPIAEEKGLTTQQVGLIFAVNPFGAFLASVFLARSLTKENRCYILPIGLLMEALGLLLFLCVEWINNIPLLLTVTILARLLQGFVIQSQKIIIYLGGCIILGPAYGLSITFFFQGPDKSIVGLEHSLAAVAFAWLILGFSCAMIFIPSLPLLNELLLSMYPNQYERSGNIASILFNFSTYCGEFIGPLVGGIMTENFGYIHGCSITGMIILIIAILYAIVLFKGDKKINSDVILNVPLFSKTEKEYEVSTPINYFSQTTTIETPIDKNPNSS